MKDLTLLFPNAFTQKRPNYNFNNIPMLINDVILKHLILLLLTIQLVGCGERDYLLEIKVSEKLEDFKKNNKKIINLNDWLGENWRKICIQGPYTFEEQFAQYSKEKIKKLLVLGPNDNGLWIFYNDGSISSMIINQKFMAYARNPLIGTLCTSPRYPFLYSTKYNGRKAFYFFDKINK